MDEKKELETNSQPPAAVDDLTDMDIFAVRTFKNDINQTVHKDKISTAKILLAEQKQKEKESEVYTDVSIKRPTNILAIFFGVLLLIAAVGVVGYFGYNKIVKQTINPVEIKNSFLFIFDSEKLIDADKEDYEIAQEVEKNIKDISSMKDNTFTDFIFFKTDPTTKSKDRIKSSEFFNIYNIKLPTLVARSISKDFTYGFYKTNGRVEPFLVIGIVDYENLYASMFLWEQNLALDIKDLFPVLKNLFDISNIRNNLVLPQDPIIDNSVPNNIASSSATSTMDSAEASTSTEIVLTPEQELEKRDVINRAVRFVDVVFSNKDARAVRDTTGNPFFFYSFIDRDKIIFAQDPKILGEVIRKIKEKSLVR